MVVDVVDVRALRLQTMIDLREQEREALPRIHGGIRLLPWPPSVHATRLNKPLSKPAPNCSFAYGHFTDEI